MYALYNGKSVQREAQTRNIKETNKCTKNKCFIKPIYNNLNPNSNNTNKNKNNNKNDNDCPYVINVEQWNHENGYNEYTCRHENKGKLMENKSFYYRDILYTSVNNTCALNESKKKCFIVNQQTKEEKETDKKQERDKNKKSYYDKRYRKYVKQILINRLIHIQKQTNNIDQFKTKKLSNHWIKKRNQTYRNKKKHVSNHFQWNSHFFFPSRTYYKRQFTNERNKTYSTSRIQRYKYQKYQTEKIKRNKWLKKKFGYCNSWSQQIHFNENHIVPCFIQNKKIYSPRKQTCNTLHKTKCTKLKNHLVSSNVKFAETVELIHSNKKIETNLENRKSILKKKKKKEDDKEKKTEKEKGKKNLHDNSVMETPTEIKCLEKYNNLSTRMLNESSSYINDIHPNRKAYIMHYNIHNDNNGNNANSNNNRNNYSNTTTNNNTMNSNNTIIMNNNNTRHNNDHIQNGINHMNNIINGLNERVTDTFDLNESLFSDLDAYVDAFVRTGSVASSSDTVDDLQAIHKATKAGNISLIKNLLDIGVNVNSKTKHRQFTPLHLAAAKGDIKCLKLLIDSNADINAVSSDYETPLWCASITNHLEICKYLLQKGALVNINVQTQFYDSPLHAASMMGHFEIVKLLVEHGANTKCLDSNILEPLHYASFEGHKGIVKYLIWHQIKEALNKKMEEIVTNMKKYDIYNKKLETYYYLKYKSIFKKKITGKVLCCAITSGNNKIVNIILKGGADPNYFDIRLQLFPVHAASITGNIKIFKDLVKKGANIFTKTSCNNSPIDLTEDADIKNFILERSRKINIRNAWLIRIKSKSHILSLLSYDMFYRVCTFF